MRRIFDKKLLLFCLSNLFSLKINYFHCVQYLLFFVAFKQEESLLTRMKIFFNISFEDITDDFNTFNFFNQSSNLLIWWRPRDHWLVISEIRILYVWMSYCTILKWCTWLSFNNCWRSTKYFCFLSDFYSKLKNLPIKKSFTSKGFCQFF